MYVEHRFKVKHIYEFAREYLRAWFPKLLYCVAYVNRINRLNEVFKGMSEPILRNYLPPDCDTGITLIDSMPVITGSGKRKAMVVKEITDNVFCSTKGIYYYGLNLHALGFRRKRHLPHLKLLLFTEASVNDLTFLKENCDDIYNRTFFGDKIYVDKDFWIDKQLRSKKLITCKSKSLRDLLFRNFSILFIWHPLVINWRC
jgi:hypothetical protein